MVQGHKSKISELITQKWLLRSPKVKFTVELLYFIVITQDEFDILVITQVRGQAESGC